MSPFFDDLEAQLRAAAHDHAPDQAQDQASLRRRWLRSGLRGAPVALAVLVTMAVVVGAVALLGHGRGGAPASPGAPKPPTSPGALLSHPGPHLRQELRYIALATNRADRSPGCRNPPMGRTEYSQGSPGPSLLSILGVLRRPATTADRLARDAYAGNPVVVYVRYVRRARVMAGVSYYVIPARTESGVGIPPPRCFALAVASLHAELPRIPVALREPTLSFRRP